MSNWTQFYGARAHITDRLASELSPDLVYHCDRHTLQDVLPAAERLGRMAGLDDADLLSLMTAALFHDTGFLKQYHDHETASIAIARNALPGFGYTPEQIDQVTLIIAATRMPQRPRCLLQQLMCDADLDLLGRDDFWELNRQLLEETRCFGTFTLSDEAWFTSQIRFLEDHAFFTPQARTLRDAGKAQNISRMYRALDAVRRTENGVYPQWAMSR